MDANVWRVEMSKKQKKEKLLDAVGIFCGLIVLAFIVGNIIASHMATTIGDADVPDDAQTLTGSAIGRNGPIDVEVVATPDRIYQIKVTNHEETEGIGSVAVEKLPVTIYETQSLAVDSVSGATITSDGIKNAVIDALQSGGIDPAAFQNEVAAAAPVEKDEVELDCDVVVVGAGGAGLTASVLATQNGEDVILLEKMPFVGGNSLRAEGGMNAAGTKVEKELGLDDSTVENFVEDTMNLGHNIANRELVQTLAENSAEAVDWLYSIDAPLPTVVATGGTTHKYLHKPEDGSPVGEYLVEKLKVQVDKLGIDVKTNTTATEILMENGQAVGVKANDNEHNYTIHAKSVVLTTGGFGANFDLMAISCIPPSFRRTGRWSPNPYAATAPSSSTPRANVSSMIWPAAT